MPRDDPATKAVFPENNRVSAILRSPCVWMLDPPLVADHEGFC
jgi:hypothetical protein